MTACPKEIPQESGCLVHRLEPAANHPGEYHWHLIYWEAGKAWLLHYIGADAATLVEAQRSFAQHRLHWIPFE